MSEVITIPAYKPYLKQKRKQRVAAYCRVSTKSDDQQHSLLTMTTHYTAIAQAHADDWEFVGIYADKGLSGTNTHRFHFLRLVEDCKEGKIDIVLVKSISRMARNTIDLLATVQELRNYGTKIIFERDKIDTENRLNDVKISLTANVAQEESISHSKNVKKGQRKRMENGLLKPKSFAIGLKKSNTYYKEIDADCADIIKYICNAYHSKGYEAILKELIKNKVPCPNGGKWTKSTIINIIDNEAYMGDTRLQKFYTPDVFPFKKIKNRGEIKQIYYKNSHPAIISRDCYEINQRIRKYEKHLQRNKTVEKKKYIFTSKIVCGECDSRCKRRIIKKTCVTWGCTQHLLSSDLCPTKSAHEEDLKNAFARSMHKLNCYKKEILESIISTSKKYKNSYSSSEDEIKLNKKISDILEQNIVLNRQMSNKSIDFALFLQKQAKLDAELNLCFEEMNKLEIGYESDLITKTNLILDQLNEHNIYSDVFDEDLFKKLIYKIYLYSDDTVEFELINKLRLREKLC